MVSHLTNQQLNPIFSHEGTINSSVMMQEQKMEEKFNMSPGAENKPQNYQQKPYTSQSHMVEVNLSPKNAIKNQKQIKPQQLGQRRHSLKVKQSISNQLNSTLQQYKTASLLQPGHMIFNLEKSDSKSKPKKHKGPSRTLDIRNPLPFNKNPDDNQTFLKCGRCGGGPLILMGAHSNERLFTESEVKSIVQELHHEIDVLNHIRDQQTSDIHAREDEIAKLIFEQSLLQEEKQQLRSQVESITHKSLESLEFQTALFTLCDTLQQKLKAKELTESDMLQQMDLLIRKTDQSNKYAAESRMQIETLQRELAKMQRGLQSERERNHQLVSELNSAHDEQRERVGQGEENEALKKELASLSAELTVARHQYQNLKYRTFEQQELLKQQENYYKSQLDAQIINNFIHQQSSDDQNPSAINHQQQLQFMTTESVSQSSLLGDDDVNLQDDPIAEVNQEDGLEKDIMERYHSNEAENEK
ncbi:hypothetical protein FGO68_gene6364 [Halteria grandinella]|uniref:Uncharacterized protein n=1 Tax=Halteria grandinella TaxID=5974 RepID=A0A8J8T3B5_HALGN|nr:hypothetical protein FGO68_gene6364 [Halteria grandinella]